MRINPRKITGAIITIALLAAALIVSTEAAAGDGPQGPGAPSEARFIGTPVDTDAGLQPTNPEVSLAKRVAPLLELQARPEPPAAEVIVPEERVLAVDQDGQKFPAADPALVRDGDVWRLYTTNTFWSNVPTWVSDDMEVWTKTPDALPKLPGWARKGQTWAPDVVKLDGHWVLFFSALYGQEKLHCIGHAIADSAVGPYEPFPEPIVCERSEGGSIDPMVHVDSAGDPHLLWKVDANNPLVGGRSGSVPTARCCLVSQPISFPTKEAGSAR